MCNWPIRVHYFLLLCYFVSFYLGSEGGGGIPRKTWVGLWGMSCKTELTLIFLNYAMGFSLPCLRPDLKEVTEGAGREQNVIRTTLRARDQHTQAPTYGLTSILPIRMHTAISPGQWQPWTSVLPLFELISMTWPLQPCSDDLRSC